MSISLNSTSKWKARNMPSFLQYIDKNGKLPVCLTMSLAAYIAFYSNDISELTDAGLICKRPAGNAYTVSDDRWALEFYYDHRNDSDEDLVKAVLAGEDRDKYEAFRKKYIEAGGNATEQVLNELYQLLKVR